MFQYGKMYRSMGEKTTMSYGFEENLKRIEKAIKFVEHIEKHLKVLDALYGGKREVCCKICGKTINEI